VKLLNHCNGAELRKKDKAVATYVITKLTIV